jgi:hypothetical protein
MSIFIPPSLSSADAIVKTIPLLEQLVGNRATIESDIKSFHALNEAEAEKAQKARDLIKEHFDILEETRKTSLKNQDDSDKLKADKVAFEEEKKQEYQKIADAKLPTNEALTRAQELRDEAEATKNSVISLQESLNADKGSHALNVAQLAEEKKSVEEERKKIDEYKQSVIELDRQTKANLEALKKFNF